MAANDFQEFLEFIHKITGNRPYELEESLKDVLIYVPCDKKPPEREGSSTCSTSQRISIITYLNKWNADFRRLIYDGDWKLIESIIGYDILRFCLSDCVLGKKTKTGAIMVSKLTGLEYKSANDNRPEKLDEIFYKSASALKICAQENRGIKSVDIDDEESFDWKEVQKNLLHVFSSSSDVEISLDNLILKFSRSRRFSKNHVLQDKKKTTISLSQEVMKTRVGICKFSGYEKCLEQLEEILKEFKNNHAKYNYGNSLDGLLLWNEKDSSKLKNELPISVVKEYFSHICSNVLPKRLFGSNKNVNSVIKIVCDLLEAPRYQMINLRLYILKMKVSDIRWLDEVTNSDTQWILIGKLLKWLMNNFIFEILRTQFYIITISPSTKKIYFKQSDWQKSVTAFVKKLYKDEVIASIEGLCIRGPPIGNWFLFPKKNGIRPILAAKRAGNKKESIQQTLNYLQQIYVTKYGNFGKEVFQKSWRDIVGKYENCDEKPLYIVSCDIEAAFESIDQRKLIKIIESHADLSKKYITMKHYKIGKNLRKINSIPFKSKRFVAYPELELPLSKGSVFALSSEKPLTIPKEDLLRHVRSYVLNQHVIIKNRRFVLQKGIAQGAILSPILCDLYYATMTDEKLSRFRDQGFLYRYVDDFLFVTDDRALAEEFLEQIKTGFPDYNCVFTAAKTKTNLPGHGIPIENITYLGYRINVKNFEVTVDYLKDTRYSTIASKPQNNILKYFRQRLCNLAPLKLDGLVLDSKVNSEDTIVNTVKCAFIKQAERCLCLLRTMFDDIRKNVAPILKIIRSTNLKIFRIVRRHLNASGPNFENLVPRLAVLPWKSYRQVFGKDQSIHEHFRILFLINIKMTKNIERS